MPIHSPVDERVVRVPPSAPVAPGAPADEAAARRDLRRQVADLDRRLSDVALAAFPFAARLHPAPASGQRRAPTAGARVLGLGELEQVRDELAERLRAAQQRLGRLGEQQERARERLEEMLREPRRHKFARVANADLGEAGCAVWQVRPRLGLVGMLAGWWEVKLSSGCPSAAAA